MNYLKSIASVVFFILPISLFSQSSGLINSGELLDKGNSLNDSGQYKKAISLYEQVTRNDTNYVRSLLAKAISCQADSQFNKAVEYCKEGLVLKQQRDLEPELYNTYGNALISMGKTDEAIKIFDTGISKYPAYSLLYFNKGIVYFTLDKYEEAEKWFQKTLLINPYMYSAHYQLGRAALRQGKIIPAFLSFISYLLANPQGKYISASISLLGAISKSNDDVLQYKDKRSYIPNENYQAVEDIVLSKIALDKAYKPIITLDDPISRQIQVVFEKLEFQETNNDFWMQYYVPFYKQLYNDGKFELLVNYIFSGIKVAEIQEYNKKNKRDIEAFVDGAASYFSLLRSTRELMYNKRASVSQKYIYEDGNLVGKGAISADGKLLSGSWYFYYHGGNLKSVGQFNGAGQRDGDWSFYYFSGKIKGREHFRNGKTEGKQENYYENGLVSFDENYLNGQLDGVATYYYRAGNLKSNTMYRQGKINGEEKLYYSNGALLSVNNYSDDIRNGLSTSYYKSGQLKETEQYLNGKLEGNYKSYYESGGINAQGVFKKDKGSGEWKYYYEDGKMRQKRSFNNESEDGLCEEYYENGQVSARYALRKGKAQGEALYYDKDGKLYNRFVFDNGAIESAKYFNKSGQEIYSSAKKNNVIDIISYSPAGFITGHGTYNKRGDEDGGDTVFYPSGKISQLNVYSNGELNGPAVAYYANGREKSTCNMINGKEDGYYKGYYFSGQIQSEGWFVEGKAEGDWKYYDEQGKLSVKNYFIDGDLYGFREEYNPDGKISTVQKYYGGWLEEMTQYDSAGNILEQDSFPQGTGRFRMLYDSKQKMVEANYVHGDFDGAYKIYYYDGSISSIQFYKKGLKDSVYTSLFWGGIKSQEGSYKYGQKYGVWKNYAENGKLSTTTEYAADQINGTERFYHPDGTTDFESLYKEDKRNGIATKYEPRGTLAYQVLYDDDKVVGYFYLGKEGKLTPIIPVAADKGSISSYFPNGQLSRQGHYIDGKIDGPDVLYYPDGKILSTDTTSYGERNGFSNVYYGNGKMQSQYNYLHDNLNGPFREFYENGSIEKEGKYINGLPHGLVKYYDEKGNLVHTKFYYYGKLISAINEK